MRIFSNTLFIYMATKSIDIDTLIDIFNSLSSDKSEMGEQEEGGDTGGGGKAPTKHFDLYKPNRGVANQIGNTKWSDSYPIKRGVANTLF
jgi:hypothetical protein